MYKSFVTCHDPKGVVECGTIRKYKAGSQEKMGDGIESHGTHKNFTSNESLMSKAEKGMVSRNRERFSDPSSFQLLEVSRGTRKLNQTIESWIEGNNYERQSQDIAKDLLKGALDLQESLIMLGKLQESSQLTAQLKMKKKENPERGRDDELKDQISSSTIRGWKCQMEYQKPRNSVDGSSRDSIEELKKAIRDGLARQDSLRNSTQTTRMMDSASDIPSTSTSQSSATHSGSDHSSCSSILQKDTRKKDKGPSLIAKLMGLEDFPSKSLQRTPQKQFSFDSNSSQQMAVFDIALPKTRNSQPIKQKVDSEKKSLKEVLETLQFKGLLKSSSVEDKMSQPHQPSNVFSQQRRIDEIMPIVLIKPVRMKRLETNNALETIDWEEQSLKKKLMLRKMDVKEQIVTRKIKYKDAASGTGNMHCEIEAQNNLGQNEETGRLSQQEGTADHREVILKPEEKKVEIIEQKEDYVTAKKMHDKLVAENIPKIKSKKEERSNKKLVSKEEVTEVKTKHMVSSKMKAPNLPSPKTLSKKVTDKKADGVQKVRASSQLLTNGEIVKPGNVQIFQDHGKLMTPKLKRPEVGSTITKSRTPKKNTTTLKPIPKNTLKASRTSKDQRKKKSSITLPAAIEPKTQTTGSKDEDMRLSVIFDGNTRNSESNENYKRVDLPSDNLNSLQEVMTTISDQPPGEGKADELKVDNEDHTIDNQIQKVLLLPPYCGKDSLSEEAEGCLGKRLTNDTSCKTGIQIKVLLLNSPSFLNQAEEICHLNTRCENISTKSDIYVSEASEVTIYLDFAIEVIKRKSLPDSQTKHTLLPPYISSRMPPSLDELMKEICNGIKILRSYRECLPGNSLYAMLERDIRCNEGVSSIWDIGWRNTFSVDDAEQAVKDVENLLVSQLIDELFA